MSGLRLRFDKFYIESSIPSHVIAQSDIDPSFIKGEHIRKLANLVNPVCAECRFMKIDAKTVANYKTFESIIRTTAFCDEKICPDQIATLDQIETQESQWRQEFNLAMGVPSERLKQQSEESKQEKPKRKHYGTW